MHSLTWKTTYWTIHPRREGVLGALSLPTHKKKRFRTGGFIEYGVLKFYMAVVDNHSLTDPFKGMQISTLELPAAFEQNAWAAQCCFLLGPALLPPSSREARIYSHLFWKEPEVSNCFQYERFSTISIRVDSVKRNLATLSTSALPIPS